jgi:putative DNA primase/helicase
MSGPYYDVFLCPDCREETTPSRLDDINTQWFKCKNGHETATPIKNRLNALSPSEMREYYDRDDEEQKFNPNNYAATLMKNFFFRTDKKTDLMYVYESKSGVWHPDGEIFVHVSLVENLGEKVKPHYLPDVVFYIKGATYQDVKETPSLIALENGILNVETQKLEEPNPGYFILSKLPVTYDPKADCPIIKKFLSEIFGESQLTALQEAIGYTLLKSMPFHKAFMLLGDGSNGKSTFLTLLQTFLGRENYSNVTLQEICNNRFASANLYGKMANISADLPKTAIETSGRFKMLTGSDAICAEFKHKNAFQFVNIAKMFYSCNEFPQTTEDTLAYVRRWKIFNCTNVFLGEKCDPKIIEKITTSQELSGFLNYALEGLKRLLENGKFSINETEEELRSNILKLSNPTKAFLEARVESSKQAKDFIPEAKLYTDFITFCDTENLPTVRKAQFTAALKEYMPDIKQTNQRILNKPTPVYQYVKYTVASVTALLLDAEKNHIFIESNKRQVTEVTESNQKQEQPSIPEKSEIEEPKQLLLIAKSRCEPCEGKIDGAPCGTGSDFYLYDPRATKPYCYCQTHRDEALRKFYPLDKWEINYGSRDGGLP